MANRDLLTNYLTQISFDRRHWPNEFGSWGAAPSFASSPAPRRAGEMMWRGIACAARPPAGTVPSRDFAIYIFERRGVSAG